MNPPRDSKLQNNLEAIEEHFAILADVFHDYAIYLLDVNGSIRKTNACAEQMSGYLAGESVGQNISILYQKEESDAYKPRLENRRRAKPPRTLWLSNPQGWIRVPNSDGHLNVGESGGEIYGYIHAMRYVRRLRYE